MLDRNGNEMSAKMLNDDGVVLLLCAVFMGNDCRSLDTLLCNQGHKNSTDTDTMANLFGGGCKTGNSHNGAYQLGLNMTRIALRKYAGKLTR